MVCNILLLWFHQCNFKVVLTSVWWNDLAVYYSNCSKFWTSFEGKPSISHWESSEAFCSKFIPVALHVLQPFSPLVCILSLFVLHYEMDLPPNIYTYRFWSACVSNHKTFTSVAFLTHVKCPIGCSQKLSDILMHLCGTFHYTTHVFSE